MKMKDRDKAALLVVVSIIIVVAVYFLVFSKFNEKTDTLTEENNTLTTEVDRLRSMEANKQQVEDETAEITKEINDILVQFPADYRTEDIIVEMNNMYDKEIKAVKMDSESFSVDSIFYGAMLEDTAATTEEETEDVTLPTDEAAEGEEAEEFVAGALTTEQLINNSADFVGYTSDVSLSFSTSYIGFKKVVDYIENNEARMVIKECSVTEGDSGNRYNVNMTIGIYRVEGTGATYEAPEIDGIKDGTPNIFK
ncbi:MAG: hypothetical protein K6G11_07235 [Lachnospiraceae bacterium]|nr:hypothetical protein [Lachnospiraceae bacterium]